MTDANFTLTPGILFLRYCAIPVNMAPDSAPTKT